MCHTPEVVSEERPTKYMYVSACMKNENKEHYKRKIKLILIDHFHDQGVPYDRECDPDEEEKDEPGEVPLLLKNSSNSGEGNNAGGQSIKLQKVPPSKTDYQKDGEKERDDVSQFPLIF